MAWYEKDPSGNFFACFRIGSKRYKRSLKTAEEQEAADLVARIRDNLRQVERGRQVIPANVDLMSFLMSDGRLNGQVVVPEQVTLHALLNRYFADIPEGSLERSTIQGMKIHQKHLERHLGRSFPIRTLSRDDLQDYVAKRAKEQGTNGAVTGTTIKKAIVTLRTVWNWGVEKRLVEGPFPNKRLMYPKSEQKPPYTPFRDVQRQVQGMTDAEAAERWECVFLPKDELATLLDFVKATARLPFIYPAIVFAAHTGARRSEVARARLADVDFASGLVTLRERKRAHDAKTTRRVPMSELLKTVLAAWLRGHPGGKMLFCHGTHVERSKKRSVTTGHRGKKRPTTVASRLKTIRIRPSTMSQPLTWHELHDHFKRTLQDSEWKNLKGWHVLRHSFISALAQAGTSQNIIDEFSGHTTDEQRRRYRHLLPSSSKAAINSVFG